MDSAFLFDTVVVGGGLAGTTVAAELARSTPPGFRLCLIEARDPGPGNAYDPASDRLYMNGTAISMSAVPSDKRDLVRWLAGSPYGERSQIPRPLYGRYLAERYFSAVENRPEFTTVRAEVVDLVAEGDHLAVVDDRGTRHRTRSAVLALGNFPPGDAFLPEALRRHPGYVADPWRFDPLAREGDVLAIGSGLTALDAVALLDERGFRGTIHLVSRRGLVPCVDDTAVEAADPATLDLRTETPYALLRTMRAEARRAVEAGGDWRPVIEAIREMTPSIWLSWSLRERRRFLRHLASLWSVHRYRVPPQTASVFERLEREGRAVRHRGRVKAARPVAGGGLEVDVAGPGGLERLRVASAINCTGPNGDYERARHPLVRNLLSRGTIRPDPLRLGLDATTDLRVVDRRGQPSDRIFALGPPLRGIFYETTAVPETCRQAASIARALAEQHALRRLDAVS